MDIRVLKDLEYACTFFVFCLACEDDICILLGMSENGVLTRFAPPMPPPPPLLSYRQLLKCWLKVGTVCNMTQDGEIKHVNNMLCLDICITCWWWWWWWWQVSHSLAVLLPHLQARYFWQERVNKKREKALQRVFTSWLTPKCQGASLIFWQSFAIKESNKAMFSVGFWSCFLPTGTPNSTTGVLWMEKGSWWVLNYTDGQGDSNTDGQGDSNILISPPPKKKKKKRYRNISCVVDFL